MSCSARVSDCASLAWTPRAQEGEGGGRLELVDVDLAVEGAALGQGIEQPEARGDEEGHAGQPAVGGAEDQVAEPAIKELAEGAAPRAVVLDFLQTIQNQKHGRDGFHSVPVLAGRSVGRGGTQ